MVKWIGTWIRHTIWCWLYMMVYVLLVYELNTFNTLDFLTVTLAMSMFAMLIGDILMTLFITLLKII